MTVAVGFFDGVHLGHRAILAGADVALTFENHPLALLAPERAPRLVFKLDLSLERGDAVLALLDKLPPIAEQESDGQPDPA